MILCLAVVALAGIACGQKSPYASKPVLGVLPHYTTPGALGNREGIEATTTPLPANLQGTLEEDAVVKRVSQWPEEKQPYWYKNKHVITNQREIPVSGSGYEETKVSSWGGDGYKQEEQKKNVYEGEWGKYDQNKEQKKTVYDDKWSTGYNQNTKVVEDSGDWSKNYKDQGGIKEYKQEKHYENNDGYKHTKNDKYWNGGQQKHVEEDGGYLKDYKKVEEDGGYLKGYKKVEEDGGYEKGYKKVEEDGGYKQEEKKDKKGSGWFNFFGKKEQKKTVTDEGGRGDYYQTPAKKEESWDQKHYSYHSKTPSYGHSSYHHHHHHSHGTGYGSNHGYAQKPQLR